MKLNHIILVMPINQSSKQSINQYIYQSIKRALSSRYEGEMFFFFHPENQKNQKL